LKNFNLVQIVNLLPVFFFILAISPNINSDRIGLVLVAVFLLLIPSANYIAVNPDRKISSAGDNKYSFVDFVALVMVIVVFYLGWLISWQFNLLQGLYLFTVIVISKQERNLSVNSKWFIGRVIQGILLFATIYLGLNLYGFNNLLRIHIIIFTSLTIILIITSLYISNLREYCLLHKDDFEKMSPEALKPIKTILLLILLLLLAYVIFFTTTYHWHYAEYFALALMPSVILAISLFRQANTEQIVRLTTSLQWLNMILSTCLVIFFIYFFLDSTQVLQAIRGGY
jgi:hypothetical protein